MVDIMAVEADLRMYVARGRVLKAALDSLAHAAEEDQSGAFYDAQGEYLDDTLSRAALDLVRATSASERQPIGWATA